MGGANLCRQTFGSLSSRRGGVGGRHVTCGEHVPEGGVAVGEGGVAVGEEEWQWGRGT